MFHYIHNETVAAAFGVGEMTNSLLKSHGPVNVLLAITSKYIHSASYVVRAEMVEKSDTDSDAEQKSS